MKKRTRNSSYFCLVLILMAHGSCNIRKVPQISGASKSSYDTSSICLKIQIDSFYSSGFDYSITNMCDKEILLIKNFDAELAFSNELNFQNPKISNKKVFPIINWENERAKQNYFSSNIYCGEVVASVAPYYILKMGQTVFLKYDLVYNNFQPLKKDLYYKGYFSISVPVEYKELCPKLFIGSIQTQFFCKL